MRVRVLSALALAIATAAAVVGGLAAPASASVTFTASSSYLPLNALDIPRFVTPGPDYPFNLPLSYYPDLSYVPPGNPNTFYLQQGEQRRITEQLDVSINAGNKAEMNNAMVCLDPEGNPVRRYGFDHYDVSAPAVAATEPEVRASAGTNYLGTAGQHFVWRLSMLIQAGESGNYDCGIQAQTGSAGDTSYEMTVWPMTPGNASIGTWIQVSDVNQAGAQQFDYFDYHGGNCTPADQPDPTATDPPDAPCQYFGGQTLLGYDSNQNPIYAPINPPQADILNSLILDRFTAASDATTIDALGSFQLTSCPEGTASCVPAQWGFTYATVTTYLELDQLNPDGSVCKVNTAYGSSFGQTINSFTITRDAHHQPITYDLTVPVSQNCGGSRLFQMHLHMNGLSGSPVKIDGGNVNVINSVRATTTTVPPVLWGTKAQADAAIQGAQLTEVPTYVMSTAAAGTVLSQNSPGGTVEPTGSPVQITVSLGQVGVPYVIGWDQYSAEQAIQNAGLNFTVSYNSGCTDPGNVITQNPSGGVQVTPGSSVHITVSTCPSGGGGSGGGSGGGGSGGGPILPK